MLKLPLTVLVLSASILPATKAIAEEQDVLQLRLSETLAHDNNLLRLPANVDPAALGLGQSSRSSLIRTEAASLSLDKGHSLQRLQLTATFGRNHFENFRFLDHDFVNFDGRWNWSLTPHVTGQLAAERKQSLNSFADYQNYQRSLRTTESLRANAEIGRLGALHFVAGAGTSKSTNTIFVDQDNDTRSDDVSAGARYVSAGDNSVGYLLRQTRVSWLNRALDSIRLYDTRARQLDHEINAVWTASPRIRVGGAISRVQRRHDMFDARDFSGTGGRIDVNWSPAHRLRFDVFAKRETSAWWDNTASYSVTDSLSLTPSWLLATKVTLKAKLERSNRDFLGPVAPSTVPPRQDRMRSALVGIDWTPMRSLLVGASIQHDRRTSSRPTLEFTDTTATIRMQLSF